ncbi:hypothetical protein [Pseudomonas sp. GZD-222]|uniref:hypothetical protein n=1 Tax=Pseudomonas sp. GZD-222 TaxID=3404805 RepID=UPI003BB62A9F
MIYGVEIRSEINIATLDMTDFTLSKIASMDIPATSGGMKSGKGTRTDYITWNIPGYEPGKCFLILTPKVYAGNPQNGQISDWGVLPTYRELGGSSIAIYTYCNRRRPTGVGSNYIDEWIERACATVIEAVRVI